MTSDNGDDRDRGSAIGRRFEALGMSDRQWHTVTGIDRKTLHRAIANETITRSSTYTAIESWLDKLESANDVEPVASDGLIEFDITGDFGVHVVVRGGVADADVLRAQAAAIIRDIRTSAGGG